MGELDLNGIKEVTGILLTPGGMALGIWLLFKYLRSMKAELKKDLVDQTTEFNKKIDSVNADIHNNGFVRKDNFNTLREDFHDLRDMLQRHILGGNGQ